MISWLKKHFIPHKGNDHRPHILRDDSTRALVGVIIFFEIFSFLIPIFSNLHMTGGMAAVLPAVLDDLTNEEREEQNLGTLAVSPVLNEAAQMKANDMAAKGYFAHTSPEGRTPWYWLEQAGYTYQYAGENLAINFTDSKDVTTAWMNSPTHRANIVKENYTEMGTGVATGTYEGKQAVFVAQVYANPAPKVAPVVEKIVTPPKTNTGTKTVPKQSPKQPQTQIVKTENPVAVVAPENTQNVPNVLGAENNITPPAPVTTSVSSPTVMEKLLASPRSTMNVMLYVVFVIIFTALLLYIFLKMKNHHKDLITNGLVVMAVLGAVFVINYNVTHLNMAVTESLDYASQSAD